MRGGIIILEGQNITLKGLEYHQLPILKEWMNDFEIAIKLLRIEPSITYFTEIWYNSFQDDRTKLIFSINDRLSDKFIGCIDLAWQVQLSGEKILSGSKSSLRTSAADKEEVFNFRGFYCIHHY